MAYTHENHITVSAILPIYNAAAFLNQAIQSLLNQSEPFTEIIIIDDGSTDDSLVLIHAFAKAYPSIHLIQHQQNQGVCQALNHGIEQATGHYILLCAADDWYHHNLVAIAKQAIRQFPTVGLICGDAIVQRFDQAKSFYRALPYTKKHTLITAAEFKEMAKQGYIGFNGGGGMLLNRQAVINAGLLYPQLRWHSDWLLYLVVALQHGIYYANDIFVYINCRKEGYGEGKHIWRSQRQVMIDTIKLLVQRYPQLWNDFKAAALLPHYRIRYIYLFLRDPMLRRFFTWRLLWKLVLNNAAVVRISRLFPYGFVLKLRKLLKA